MSLPGSEQWRPIPGYEGSYEVSDRGRIRSYKTGGTGRSAEPRIRALKTHKKGYLRARLQCGGSEKMVYVHKLVLLAFVGPRPEWAEEIRHLDGDPANNHVSNLRYGTRLENAADVKRHGRGPGSWTHCKRGHEFTEENTRLSGGSRVCRTCKRAEALKRYHATRKAQCHKAA